MYTFKFDYSKYIMLKIDIANPDNKGGTNVIHTFEQALEAIKKANILTLGAPKIVYLVGWQYLGHDDKYPAFFEVNEAAKRPQDESAQDSLLWLINEAKKYNTVVSLHINLSDAYPDSPLWDEYMKNDLILLNRKNKPKVTGVWNGRKAYQVRFKQEYESGYFKKRVDKLFELVPLDEIGTIHVDAFFVRKGKGTKISDEKIYRRKMIEYFLSRGVDVTSEFIYRELNCGYRSLWGKSDVIGLIPAFWHLRMTQRDYMKYSPQVLAGGSLNMDLQWDKDLEYLFYGNCHGEGAFNNNDYQMFAREFSLMSVPYLFLNKHKLKKITGFLKNRRAFFSDGVISTVKNKKIIQNGKTLKENNSVFMPVAWLENTYYAWSDKDRTLTIDKPHQVFEICETGYKEINYKQNAEQCSIKMSGGRGYMFKY